MIKFTHHYPEPKFYIEYENLEKLANERNIDALMMIYDKAIYYIRNNNRLKFYRNGRFEIETNSERYLPTYFGRLPIVFSNEDFPLEKLFLHFTNESISILERIQNFRSKLLKPEFNEKISYVSSEHVNYTVFTPLEEISINMAVGWSCSKDYKNCWSLHVEGRGMFSPSDKGLSSEEFKKVHRYFQTLP